MEVKPGYKQTEVGVIPKEWDVEPCRRVSKVITVGIVVKPTQYYQKHGVPALRSANVRENQIDRSDLIFISEKANAQQAKSQVRAGDVVTVRTGYPGTSAVVPSDMAGSNCIDILITRPTDRLDSTFLSAWINSPRGKDQVLRSQNGLAQQHFNVGELRELLVALPPLPEQRAIAEALSDVDGLLVGLDRLIAKKRDLKQAAMQQLLTGQTRLPGFHGEWKVDTFGTRYAEPSRNGISKSAAFQGRGTRIVNMGEMFGFDFISNQEMGRLWLTPREIASYSLRDGDLLFGRRSVVPSGAGKCALVVKPTEPLVFESSIIRVRLNPAEANPLFHHYYFASPIGRALMSYIVSGTNVKGIRASELRELHVPLPTLAEQTAIAEVLTEMDLELAGLEQRREKTRALKQAMMQELLTGRTRLLPTPAKDSLSRKVTHD